ncbi:rare lipoprotein A [Pedobacter sp. UYEF25]
MKYVLIVVVLFCFFKSSAQTNEDSEVQDTVRKAALATYYHPKFEGRSTSSGTRYRAKKLTAAHRSLPFGTIVTVTNPENGKSVKVKITDRGPFVKRIAIDLSERAAKLIGIFNEGISKVTLKYALP